MAVLPNRWMRRLRARHHYHGTPHAQTVQSALLAVMVVLVAIVLVLLVLRRG